MGNAFHKIKMGVRVMGDGYNTDVVCNSVRYHVQTEDRGVPYCEIISQVYQRGAVLLTVRHTYKDRLDTEGALWVEGLITKQHRDILKVLARGGVDLVRAYGVRYTSGAERPANAAEFSGGPLIRSEAKQSSANAELLQETISENAREAD